jgi:Na+-transporting methylmalonyl-CoA/oxaloacetate decarboxylase gamma subunit
LISLIAAWIVFPEQLGVVGLAVLTLLAVVPWLVATAVERFERATDGVPDHPERVSGGERERVA